MVTGSGGQGDSRAARRLNEPRSVQVAVEEGLPAAVGGVRVFQVREEWRVVDRWWTEEPLDRRDAMGREDDQSALRNVVLGVDEDGAASLEVGTRAQGGGADGVERRILNGDCCAAGGWGSPDAHRGDSR